MPMDGRICHASLSYLAGYPQSSYTIPHEINCPATYATKNIHDSAHLHGYGRVNGGSTRASDIEGDEVALAALKCLAQNKKISAICLEQHDKGLVPDYEAIRARVLKEDEVLPVDQIIKRRYSKPLVQLHNFGNINSLPKYPKSIGGKPIHAETNLKKTYDPNG